MNTAKIGVFAKLNLTLDITGRENDYHLLDSLVVSVDLADRIVARKKKGALSSVSMHGMGSEKILPEENNALRAAEAFSARFQTDGADISVYKNIPVGAGLGGSSADAAGVLLALSALYGVGDRAAVCSLADELGSDVRFQLTGGYARMRGRGEQILRYPEVPALWFLVLCPAEGVSTAACYAEYDRLQKTYPPRTGRALEGFASGNPEWAARLFGNALTDAAISLLPAVGKELAALRAFSPMGWGMTGSGSAAFAAFPTRELAEWAKSRYRGKARAYVLSAVDPKQKKLRTPFALSEGEGE